LDNCGMRNPKNTSDHLSWRKSLKEPPMWSRRCLNSDFKFKMILFSVYIIFIILYVLILF
jgi:hypothetical protein